MTCFANRTGKLCCQCLHSNGRLSTHVCVVVGIAINKCVYVFATLTGRHLCLTTCHSVGHIWHHLQPGEPVRVPSAQGHLAGSLPGKRGAGGRGCHGNRLVPARLPAHEHRRAHPPARQPLLARRHPLHLVRSLFGGDDLCLPHDAHNLVVLSHLLVTVMAARMRLLQSQNSPLKRTIGQHVVWMLSHIVNSISGVQSVTGSEFRVGLDFCLP